MLIDILLANKSVAVFGGGDEATLKVMKLLDDTEFVTVVSKDFSDEIKAASRIGKIKLVEFDLTSSLDELVKLIARPEIAIIATDNQEVNRKVNQYVRGLGALVCVVDTPELCDFAMPAIAKFGKNLRVGISTRGTSPAMASILRKKLESAITETDLMQIKLQEHVRKLGKDRIGSFAERKKALYAVIESKEINDLLRENRYEDAKELAEALVGGTEK